ncbi:MAG: HAMP domain-containing sensor histidine kinase [Pseudomonadota bacterium]
MASQAFRAYGFPSGQTGQALSAYLDRYVFQSPEQGDSAPPQQGDGTNADGALATAAASMLDIAHRLRTPTNAITGCAEMLRDDGRFTADPARRSDYVDYIIQSTNAVLSNIDTLLQVASIDSNRIEVATGDMDIAELLQNALAKSNVAAKAARLTVRNLTDSASLPAFGDESLTRTVLSYVLEGVISRSAEDGKVLVRALTADGDRPVINIRDYANATSGNATDLATIKEARSRLRDKSLGLGRALQGNTAAFGFAFAEELMALQGGRLSIKTHPEKGMIIQLFFRQNETEPSLVRR